MNRQNGWRDSLKTMTTFLLLLAIALYGSRYINTWLGQRALENTGLAHLSMEDALEMTQATGKPVLVKFAAIWCGACRRLDKEVFVDENVKTILRNNFHYVRLEFEDSQDRRWFEQYGIQGFPQLLLINKDASVIGRVRTPQTAADFVTTLEQISG